MADERRTIFGLIDKLYKDMGDGTHAEVVAINHLEGLTSAENATLTIANGAALSDELDFTDKTKLIIHMPAAWTAAEIGFKVAYESGGTFNVLYDENGMRVEAEADADYVISIPSEYLAGCPYLKLWSQTAGANVNQGAERSITVSMI